MSAANKIVCAHYASSYLPLTENWIHNLLTNFKRFRPIFLTRKKHNVELFPLETIVSLSDFSKVGQITQLLIFKTIGYFLFFREACQLHVAKIVHVHFGYHGVKMLGLKRALKIPLICSFYGDDAFADSFVKNLDYQKLFIEADRILVLGPYMKKQLVSLGCAEEKLRIHHLGIETEKVRFVKREIKKDEPIRFLIASSFLEKKGVDIAVQALGQISQAYNFTIDIIGDGPLKPSIESHIEKFNLKERVKLHGYKPYDFFINLAEQCHVFIQASKTTSDNRKEGTPMAIADVMATGMMVVATRHSDIPELVVDNVTGYLANENDLPDLVGTLKRLLDEPERIAEMGEKARAHVEREFNVKTQAELLEQHYFELLNA
jgi:colanic acid/amylovoran biosynthesis glycosyltransferase